MQKLTNRTLGTTGVLLSSFLWVVSFMLAYYSCDPVTRDTVNTPMMEVATLLVCAGFIGMVLSLILRES